MIDFLRVKVWALQVFREEEGGGEFGLFAAAALAVGDGDECVADFGDIYQGVDDLLLTAGGLAVFEGVEVAARGTCARAAAAPRLALQALSGVGEPFFGEELVQDRDEGLGF